MWTVFNIVMRIFSTLLGLLLVVGGAVWALQGLNIAFNRPMGDGHTSFMVGDTHWTAYGVIAVLFGLAQIVWTNRRQING
jgi:hypothetical protein